MVRTSFFVFSAFIIEIWQGKINGKFSDSFLAVAKLVVVKWGNFCYNVIIYKYM